MTDFDPIAIATLGKAVDFLFDQAGKLMEERREARKKRGGIPQAEQVTLSHQNSITEATKKEEVRSWKPKNVYLKDMPSEITHCMSMIEQYRTNRRYTEDTISHYGGFNLAPIHIRNELLQQEEQIEQWIFKLKSIIEKTYGHKITIIGLD